MNPADIASRGIDANDKENLKIWLNGPEFLSHDSDHWPHKHVTTEVAEDDIELKKETVIFATSNDFINKWTDNFSNWKKLLCCTAWLIKFKSYCRYRYTHYQGQFTKDDINSLNIQKAEHDIFLHVQESCFQDKIARLVSGRPVKKDSNIALLNPILEDGLLRLKGRLVLGNTNNVLSYYRVVIT